jgi:hypothetical protein
MLCFEYNYRSHSPFISTAPKDSARIQGVRHDEIDHSGTLSTSSTPEVSLLSISSPETSTPSSSSVLCLNSQLLAAAAMTIRPSLKRSSYKRNDATNLHTLNFKGNQVCLSDVLDNFRSDDSILAPSSVFKVFFKDAYISHLKSSFDEGSKGTSYAIFMLYLFYMYSKFL